MDEGQPQARAAVLVARSIVYLVELAPDIGLIVGANADPRVIDPAGQGFGVVASADLDLALLRELGRVVEQKKEDLIDLGEIPAKLGQRARDVLVDQYRLPVQRFVHAEDRLVDQIRDGELVDLEGEFVLLDAPQVEDVLKRPLESGSFIERSTQALLRALGHRPRFAGEDGDGCLDNAVQRSSKLP